MLQSITYDHLMPKFKGPKVLLFGGQHVRWLMARHHCGFEDGDVY